MASHPFYTTSFKGIGPLTARELHSQANIPGEGLETGSVRYYDILRFAHERSDRLGGLRTTEDVFYEIGETELTGHRADAERIQDIITAGPIEPAISCRRTLTPKSRPGRPTYRVIVQAEDAPWRSYRRERLEAAAAQAIGSRYRKWRRVDDDSQIEFWIQVIDKTALIGLRLTDRSMRHREYKVANLPGSLRPTIAAAAVLLSKPTHEDIVLDPSCGAGTLLVERALHGPHQMLYGGDIREEAVSAVRSNFGNKHKPWEIRTWDATRLPLDEGSVTRVITNPPWGRQISAGQEVTGYYKQSLMEIERVLAPWGRAVILTSEWRAMRAGLKGASRLKVDEQIKDISVLGRKADLFSLIRTDT
ncbi:MAG: RNA methyltransferase [Gemmatimonadetes bacterium]|nr:RNA methyltransferase [Gemmatimonadota bacterium]